MTTECFYFYINLIYHFSAFNLKNNLKVYLECQNICDLSLQSLVLSNLMAMARLWQAPFTSQLEKRNFSVFSSSTLSNT